MTMLNDARDASAGSSHSASCSDALNPPVPSVDRGRDGLTGAKLGNLDESRSGGC